VNATKNQIAPAFLFTAAIAAAIVLSGCPRPKTAKAPATPPAWQNAHSMLLSLDYAFRKDYFAVTEGENLDYPLNIVATDTGIYVNRIAGFAKAFIFGDKPTAELYRLVGDSDIFKWQKATGLTPSDPVYTIYTKDGNEHIRQDFTVAVTPGSKLPEYFPPKLKESVKSGALNQIACGNFYYISASDIYMVHFVAPAPLDQKTDSLLKEMIEKMKFGASTPDEDKAREEEANKKSPDEGEGGGARIYGGSENAGRSDEGGGSNGGDDFPSLPGPGGN